MIREQTDAAYGRVMDESAGGYGQGMLEGTQTMGNQGWDLTNTMNDAIMRRARRGYDLTQAKLGAQAQQYGAQRSAQRIGKVNRLLQQERQLNDKIREMKERAEMQRKQARAQTLGNILGIVGGAAGFAMGGGPAGGMAGYQLGSGVGQAFGGQ